MRKLAPQEISFSVSRDHIPNQFHQLLFLIKVLDIYLQKRALSEVFTMAQMSLSPWNVFQKFNDLYESGKLKEQKFTLGDVTRGTLAVKQWHLKPLVSLRDETKEFLLNKVSPDIYPGSVRVAYIVRETYQMYLFILLGISHLLNGQDKSSRNFFSAHLGMSSPHALL